MPLDWPFIARCAACIAVTLAAGIAASITQGPPVTVVRDAAAYDAPRVHVETCRRGRYHYFERALLGSREPAKVIELARSVLLLGRP